MAETDYRKPGPQVIEMKVLLTDEEALSGCVKYVTVSGCRYPVQLPANARIGDKFRFRFSPDMPPVIVEVGKTITAIPESPHLHSDQQQMSSSRNVNQQQLLQKQILEPGMYGESGRSGRDELYEETVPIFAAINGLANSSGADTGAPPAASVQPVQSAAPAASVQPVQSAAPAASVQPVQSAAPAASAPTAGGSSKEFPKIVIIVALVVIAAIIAIAASQGNSSSTSDYENDTLASEDIEEEPEPEPVLVEQPMPENEHKFVNEFGNNRPSMITVENPGKYAYYMKFEDENGKTVFAFFVRPESTTPMYMGVGTFYLKYAGGLTWYGEDDLFGPETFYVKDNEPWTFENGKSWRLKMNVSAGEGNMDTDSIGGEDF